MTENIDDVIISALKKIRFYRWYEIGEAKNLLDVCWVEDILRIKPSLFRRDEKDNEGILGAYIIGHVMNAHEISYDSFGHLDSSLMASIIGLTDDELSNYCKGKMVQKKTKEGIQNLLYPPDLVYIDIKFSKSFQTKDEEPKIEPESKLKMELEREPKPIKEIKVNPYINVLQENSVHSLTATALLKIFLVPLEVLMKKNYDISYFGSKEFGADCDEKISKISSRYNIDRLSKLIDAAYLSGCQIIKNSVTENGIDRGSIIKVHKTYSW
ncbi:MAG: hypothetical protein Q7J54_05705 [Candidatus Woesearchaeota archaeon]|nr:hypothetical protein [Candidatus Woesearchaeota archaeon]